MSPPNLPPNVPPDLPCLFSAGSSPLLISVPHAGVFVPDDVVSALRPAAALLPDTDWFVDRLYAFAAELGASVLVARASRMVVDLNRPADDAPLYPGQAGTGLVPETLFDGTTAWHDPISAADRDRRVRDWWRPYHDRLRATLDQIKQRHGHAVLWDAHSIRGRVPRLFDGRLPDLNLGTYGGRSCAPSLQAAVEAELDHGGHTWVSNGRFRGGHITRHYGDPANGVHAVQLEIAQEAYMVEEPPTWDGARASALQPTLVRMLTAARDWRPDA